MAGCGIESGHGSGLAGALASDPQAHISGNEQAYEVSFGDAAAVGLGGDVLRESSW